MGKTNNIVEYLTVNRFKRSELLFLKTMILSYLRVRFFRKEDITKMVIGIKFGKLVKNGYYYKIKVKIFGE